jgi:hypothetical protein
MKIEKLITAFVTSCLLLGLVNGAKASVISVATGYEVSYGIDMKSGGSNGSDIESTFIFEWDDSHFNVDGAYTIAGQGQTYLSHIVPFAPTSALLIGYGAAVPGVGDEKDHLYTITSTDFADTVWGLKWSAAFPGVPPEPRVGHSAMISLLIDATAGDTGALSSLIDFVTTEGYRAAFDPAGGFTVVEWTTAQPVPEPATLTGFSIGI